MMATTLHRVVQLQGKIETALRKYAQAKHDLIRITMTIDAGLKDKKTCLLKLAEVEQNLIEIMTKELEKILGKEEG